MDVWTLLLLVSAVLAFLGLTRALHLDQRFYKRAYSRRIQSYVEHKNALIQKRRQESEDRHKKGRKGSSGDSL